MSGVTVRPAQPHDKEAWLPLWQGYLTFYGTDLADDVTEANWLRLLDETESMFCLVAEGEGGLLGFTHYVLHANTWTTKQVCYLEDLFTAEDARGLGVGRALIQAVVDKAKELDCHRVYWLTKEDNATARALYDKVAVHTGFIRYDAKAG